MDGGRKRTNPQFLPQLTSTVLDSSFIQKVKDPIFKVFKNLIASLESPARLSMASQCCFPYFQCSESHCPHLMDVLLLANPVLQNISSHAVMPQKFCFIKISCRFKKLNSEISILQDWLFHLLFTNGTTDTPPPQNHNPPTSFYTKQKTTIKDLRCLATAHIIFMECNLPYLQNFCSSGLKEAIGKVP